MLTSVVGRAISTSLLASVVRRALVLLAVMAAMAAMDGWGRVITKEQIRELRLWRSWTCPPVGTIPDPATLDTTDDHRYTLLHWAALGRCTDFALRLLQFKANTLARNIHWWIPLHYGAEYGADGVVKHLLNADNADEQRLTVSRQEGWMALHVATYHRKPTIIRLLMANGTDNHLAKQMTHRGRSINFYTSHTPVYYASKHQKSLDAMATELARRTSCSPSRLRVLIGKLSRNQESASMTKLKKTAKRKQQKMCEEKLYEENLEKAFNKIKQLEEKLNAAQKKVKEKEAELTGAEQNANTYKAEATTMIEQLAAKLNASQKVGKGQLVELNDTEQNLQTCKAEVNRIEQLAAKLNDSQEIEQEQEAERNGTEQNVQTCKAQANKIKQLEAKLNASQVEKAQEVDQLETKLNEAQRTQQEDTAQLYAIEQNVYRTMRRGSKKEKEATRKSTQRGNKDEEETKPNNSMQRGADGDV